MTTAANNTVKYASEFPLPGGVEQYFDTLVALLRHIRDDNVTPDSLYILNCEHSLSTIKLALDFLKSDLIEALGEMERGSLYTHVSPTTLTNKLSQLTRMMDLSELPNG